MEVPIPLPVSTHADFVERLAPRTPRTRVVYLSHITSPSALTFPVSEICWLRVREAGILAIVDRRHAPAQIPLDLQSVGAVDLYTGVRHKWLHGFKGAAFLYARPRRPLLEPLVVSWGWEFRAAGAVALCRLARVAGTRDVSRFLAVPAAIAYQAAHDCPRCASGAMPWPSRRGRIEALTGLPPVSPEDASVRASAGSTRCSPRRPAGADLSVLKGAALRGASVEVPLTELGDASYIRVSIQVYNDRDDTDALLAGPAVVVGRDVADVRVGDGWIVRR